jgi:DNA-nicking Smr family endonuclease
VNGGKAGGSNGGGAAPTFNGPRSWPASSAAGDSARFEASGHAKRRGELLAQSQAAWNAGDKAAAKKLSEEGKAAGAAMDAANARAAEAYFAANNRGKPLTEIDLHGLHVSEALDRVEQRLKQCEARGEKQLIVIVGRGNHSAGGVQKVKPAMEQLIQRHRLRVAVGSPNEGCLTIFLGEQNGKAGFVHAPGSRESGCNQM